MSKPRYAKKKDNDQVKFLNNFGRENKIYYNTPKL